ncbi:MAG: extracellular solute-binding protein [Lachnospiraceae bacterium]|nr:extracellular solute-binding protein [Lachnospiraceae bacterium]
MMKLIVNYKGTLAKLFLFIFLIFVGCGQTQNIEEKDIDTLIFSCPDSTNKSYVMEYTDAQITPDFKPLSNSFCVSGEKLYFVDNQGMTMQSICEADLSGTEKPSKLTVDLSDVFVEALTVEADNNGDSIIYCMGRTVAENSFLAAYSEEGELLFRKDFDESLSKALQNNMVYKLTLDGEGNICALSSACLYLFDKDGEYQGEVECPGKGYCSIEGCGDGKIYVTYHSEDGQKVILSECDRVYQRLVSDKEVLGNGTLYRGQNCTLLTADNNSCYIMEPNKDRIYKLFDFNNYDVSGTKVQFAVQNEAEEFIFISWHLLEQNESVEIISFRETKEGERSQDGRQLLTFLCMEGMSDTEYGYGGVVAEFNKQSDKYRVVIEEVDIDGNAEIYVAFNTRLMSKDSADIIYMDDYKEIQVYQRQGFLENLSPYLEKSEVYRKEYLLDEIVNCLETDGNIYGITESFGIDTLMGRKSQLGEGIGWTVEEFLNWLRLNPDAKGYFGLSDEVILEYCLMGNLEEYLDEEQRKALFNEEAFRKLMQEVKNLQNDETLYLFDWDETLKTGDPVLQREVISYFQEISGETETGYCDESVFIGYPCNDGVPRYFWDMGCLGILSRSECKEGAFEFIEFFLQNELSGDYYSARKIQFDAAMQHASTGVSIYDYGTKEEREIPDMTEEQRERQVEMISLATQDTMENQTIRTMIIEEARAYFAGDRTLEDTCRIIQNRVQLYLDENAED